MYCSFATCASLKRREMKIVFDFAWYRSNELHGYDSGFTSYVMLRLLSATM